MRIQEACGCGATVEIDGPTTGCATLAAGKWREQHACTVVPPGPCAHDPGVVWPTGIKPRCELRAGHDGAHECDRGSMGGTATWGETDSDDAEQRAERAEAELAALRERVRELAWKFEAMGKRAHAVDLRCLLGDDTTGAASGEGEVADSCTYCASQIKQAQERRVKTEQECERLEDLRPKPGDSGYSGYAQMFNDITFAPIVTHLLFSDRGRMADALWAAGYRKTEGEK